MIKGFVLTLQAEARDDPIRNLADILVGNVDDILYCSSIVKRHFEAAWTIISTVNSRIVTIVSEMSLEKYNRKMMVRNLGGFREIPLEKQSHYILQGM